jgi:hypothetical protein
LILGNPSPDSVIGQRSTDLSVLLFDDFDGECRAVRQFPTRRYLGAGKGCWEYPEGHSTSRIVIAKACNFPALIDAANILRLETVLKPSSSHRR